MADPAQDKSQTRPAGKEPKGPDRIEGFEQRVEKLRFHFEQYFMGNEKLPPLKEKDALQREIRQFDPGSRNAVDRFRHQNLTARFVTYETYWLRIIRAIEEGTYERDRFRANLHDKARHGDTVGGDVSAEAARELQAKARASEVGDEAAAFLSSLTGGPAIALRGKPVAPTPGSSPPAAAPPAPRQPTPLPTPGLRGQTVASAATGAPAAPMGLRGQPIAPRAAPAPPPASAAPPAPAPAAAAPPPPPSIPLRGAPVAPAGGPPAMPLRGAPVAPGTAPQRPPPSRGNP